MANSTQIGKVFENIGEKFDLMYARRAYMHWFIQEGMEEGEFYEAREDLACLERDYHELSQCSHQDWLEEPENDKGLAFEWK